MATIDTTGFVPQLQWGVFDLGMGPVFDVDTVVDLKFDNGTKISTFPVEKGAFASYNKVKNPFKAKIRLAVGGQASRIQAFLEKLAQVVDDGELYTVSTPDQIYTPVSLESYDFARTSKDGLNMIVADLTFLEIREVETAYTTVAIPPSKAKNAGSASKKNVGNQQPQDPSDPAFADLTPAQAAALGIAQSGG